MCLCFIRQGWDTRSGRWCLFCHRYLYFVILGPIMRHLEHTDYKYLACLAKLLLSLSCSLLFPAPLCVSYMARGLIHICWINEGRKLYFLDLQINSWECRDKLHGTLGGILLIVQFESTWNCCADEKS